MDLKEAGLLGAHIEAHWYYRSKAAAVSRLLRNPPPARVLDVGAGSGFFARHLVTELGASEAWCIDPGYAADHDERLAGRPVHFLRSIDAADVDTVLMMDVLEHVDDDLGLLGEYVGKVGRGTRFLLTVPAFQWLWSGHDEFLGHRRRYTLPMLEGVVREGGLTVCGGGYHFGMVLPIVAALRLAQRVGANSRPARSQLMPHHPLVNGALRGLCGLELPLLRLNRIAGLTVWCLARKDRP